MLTKGEEEMRAYDRCTEYTPDDVGHSVYTDGAAPRPCTELALQVKLALVGGGVGGGNGDGGGGLG